MFENVVKSVYINIHVLRKVILATIFYQEFTYLCSGWPGGAMVLGKLPVPGRPTHLEISRTRANCACSSCGWGLFEHLLLSSVISRFFLPFSLGDGPI